MITSLGPMLDAAIMFDVGNILQQTHDHTGRIACPRCKDEIAFCKTYRWILKAKDIEAIHRYSSSAPIYATVELRPRRPPIFDVTPRSEWDRE